MKRRKSEIIKFLNKFKKNDDYVDRIILACAVVEQSDKEFIFVVICCGFQNTSVQKEPILALWRLVFQ